MTSWHSLFLPTEQPVADTLRASLVDLGYTPFDPFGRIPGRTYPQAVRLFVAPSRGGWTRIIGEPDPRQLAYFGGLVLWLALDGPTAKITLFQDGDAAGIEALAPYLRPGLTLDHIRAALLVTGDKAASADGLPLNVLPDDLQALAGKVDPKQAQAMFNRMVGTATRRAGQDAGLADAARQLIASGAGPDWNSPGGRQLQALARCLTLPDGWQTPDFAALRDAYPLHARLRRSPNAALYPGDAEALAAVPDALDYTPVYAGKRLV